MTSDPIHYPVTHEFEMSFGGDPRCEHLFKDMARTIGEYEHGSVDVEDVFPGLTVEGYAAVAGDILTTFRESLE